MSRGRGSFQKYASSPCSCEQVCTFITYEASVSHKNILVICSKREAPVCIAQLFYFSWIFSSGSSFSIPLNFQIYSSYEEKILNLLTPN